MVIATHLYKKHVSLVLLIVITKLAVRFIVLTFFIYILLMYLLDVCGDGKCDSGENCDSCFEDCQATCTFLFYFYFIFILFLFYLFLITFYKFFKFLLTF
jgi:hypothetical protein